MTAARPDAYKVKIQLPDGTTQIQWERPAPLIEPLKVRILDVLEREGQSPGRPEHALDRRRPARRDRRPQGPDPRRRRQPADLELRAGDRGRRRLEPDPRRRHRRRARRRRGDDRRALSKVYGIPLTRRTAASLVRDMMLALGAMGAVGVASRLSPAASSRRWPA